MPTLKRSTRHSNIRFNFPNNKRNMLKEAVQLTATNWILLRNHRDA